MTTAVPSLVTEAKPPGWVCTACGSPGAHPIAGQFGGFAPIDPRYQTGYCDTCTTAHPAKPRKTPRPTSPLIREDLFDQDAFNVRKDKEKLGKLVRGLTATATVQLSDSECYNLVTLYDKYGWPGYEPTESIRAGAAKYSGEMTSKASPGVAKRKKPKNKARGW